MELHVPYSKYMSHELKTNPEALPEINEKIIQGPESLRTGNTARHKPTGVPEKKSEKF